MCGLDVGSGGAARQVDGDAADFVVALVAFDSGLDNHQGSVAVAAQDIGVGSGSGGDPGEGVVNLLVQADGHSEAIEGASAWTAHGDGHRAVGGGGDESHGPVGSAVSGDRTQ